MVWTTRGFDVPGRRAFTVAVSRFAGDQCQSTFAASPDSAWVAWTAAHRELRVLQVSTGRVWSLGTGCTPVWGPGGLAYLDPGTRGHGNNLLVRANVLAPPRRWGHGAPVAWVGQRLVFDTRTGLAIAARPGLGRTLPHGRRHPAGIVRFVAANARLTRIVLQVDTSEGSYTLPRFELIDAATLRVLDSIDGRRTGLGSGVWLGDEIVAPSSTYSGGSSHSGATLVRLRVTGDRLGWSGDLNLLGHSDGLFDGLDSVQALGANAVVVRHDRPHNGQLLDCTIRPLRCQPVVPLT